MPGALVGVRILAIAQGIARPYTGMLLAEQGADVLKIAPAQRDALRGRPGFHIWNRSKRSLVAKLASQEGHARIGRLAAEADVLIADYQSGTEDELGLPYRELRTVNPRLIYCHMPGFGSTRP